MDIQEYCELERVRVAKNYIKDKHIGFADKHDFANWFVLELQKNQCRCYYCETSIFDINKLIDSNLLKTRTVNINGKRGPVLEVDKNDKNYTKELCVLSCYYCNNDKSYIFTKEDYKKHFGKNRNLYFKGLLDELEKKPKNK